MSRSRLLVALALGACARAQHASVSDLRAYLSATYPSASGSIARANASALHALFASLDYFLGAPAAPAAGCVCGAALGTLSRSVHRDLTARAAAASGAALVSDLLALGAAAWADRARGGGAAAAADPEWVRRAARLNGSHVEVTHFRGDGHRHKGGDFLDMGGAAAWYFARRGSGVFYDAGAAAVFANKNQALAGLLDELRARPLEAHWFDLLFKRDRAALVAAVRATLARDPSARRACADVGLRCREGYVLADEYDEMMLWAARALGYDTLVLAASPMRSVEHGLVFEARERRRRRRRGARALLLRSLFPPPLRERSLSRPLSLTERETPGGALGGLLSLARACGSQSSPTCGCRLARGPRRR